MKIAKKIPKKSCSNEPVARNERSIAEILMHAQLVHSECHHRNDQPLPTRALQQDRRVDLRATRCELLGFVEKSNSTK